MSDHDDTSRPPRPDTDAVHAGSAFNATPSVASPIYQTATWSFDAPEAVTAAAAEPLSPHFYGRYSSPNTREVDAALAALEGTEDALSTGSGTAAIALVLLSLLKAGDHVVAQNTVYTSTFGLLTRYLPARGVTTTLVEQTDLDGFAGAIRPNTRLLYIETPANPSLLLTDIAGVVDLARSHGILTVADNTFATPFNQRPHALGVDLVLHSATKYLGGHSDIVAGVVCGTRAHIEQLFAHHILFGATLHPFEAWLLRRGIQTFPMRMRRHNAGGLALARWLEAHPAVRRVYYPGLASHPQHDLARRQMPGGFGGMVSFELHGGRQAGYDLLQRVRLITLGVSLGGTHSLITHPASTTAASLSDAELAAAGIAPGLVRLSVGVEDSDDLIADLAQALDTL